MKHKVKTVLAIATIAIGTTLAAMPASAGNCDTYLNDSKLAAAMYDATGLVIFRELAFSSWQSYQTCLRNQY